MLPVTGEGGASADESGLITASRPTRPVPTMTRNTPKYCSFLIILNGGAGRCGGRTRAAGARQQGGRSGGGGRDSGCERASRQHAHRLRKTREMMAVKSTTAERSIWKDEA